MRHLLFIFFAVVVVAFGLASRQAWIENRQLPDGLIQANGRTEGDHITFASKFPGRVAALLTREGRCVESGETVVRLDNAQLQAKLNPAKHAVSVTKAVLAGAEANANAAAADVKAAQTSLQLLKKQVPLAIETAEAELNHAQAQNATADSNEGLKHREHQRSQTLLESKAVSQEVADQKHLAWTVARNELTTAAAAVTTAEKRLAEAKLGKHRIAEKEDAIAALEA